MRFVFVRTIVARKENVGCSLETNLRAPKLSFFPPSVDPRNARAQTSLDRS